MVSNEWHQVVGILDLVEGHPCRCVLPCLGVATGEAHSHRWMRYQAEGGGGGDPPPPPEPRQRVSNVMDLLREKATVIAVLFDVNVLTIRIPEDWQTWLNASLRRLNTQFVPLQSLVQKDHIIVPLRLSSSSSQEDENPHQQSIGSIVNKGGDDVCGTILHAFGPRPGIHPCMHNTSRTKKKKGGRPPAHDGPPRC